MERVLVTGATGFIGLHCIKQLLDRGYRVKSESQRYTLPGQIIRIGGAALSIVRT